MPRRIIDTETRDRIVAWTQHIMRIHHIASGNELARRLGISSGAVSMLFRGNRTPGLDLLLAIHRRFHISADALLDSDPPR